MRAESGGDRERTGAGDGMDLGERGDCRTKCRHLIVEQATEGLPAEARQGRFARDLTRAGSDGDRERNLAVEFLYADGRVVADLLDQPEVDRGRIGNVQLRADQHARAEYEHMGELRYGVGMKVAPLLSRRRRALS